MSIQDDGSGLWGCRPILYAENVARSIAYYVDVLGFQLGWAWSDEENRFLKAGEAGTPTFALVGRARVHVMLSQRSQGAPGMWLHVDIDTPALLDTLHDQWARNGARIVEPPSKRIWGMYEMRVQDLDGHTLRVATHLT